MAAISQKQRGLPAPTMNRPTRTVEDREWLHEQDLLHSQAENKVQENLSPYEKKNILIIFSLV